MDRPPVAPPRFALAERSYDEAQRTERHDFLQVVLPLAGVLEMSIGDEAGSVAGLRCAVVPPSCEHRFAARGANRFLIADFHDSLGSTAGSLSGGRFLELDARGAALLPLLRVEAASGALAEPSVADALGWYARAVLGLVRSDRAPSGPAGHACREVATRARAFIDAAWDQPVSLADVASAACCSPSHATRCFRQVYGSGPVAYLHRVRIARARELLESTDLTAGEIAGRVGFVSQPWFTRLFAREVGVPPAAYRAAFLRESGNHSS